MDCFCQALIGRSLSQVDLGTSDTHATCDQNDKSQRTFHLWALHCGKLENGGIQMKTARVNGIVAKNNINISNNTLALCYIQINKSRSV